MSEFLDYAVYNLLDGLRWITFEVVLIGLQNFIYLFVHEIVNQMMLLVEYVDQSIEFIFSFVKNVVQ